MKQLRRMSSLRRIPSVETIHEEAKTEEKENENGEKEDGRVSPAKEKV